MDSGDSAENFYDQLSEQYHLIATDWDSAVRSQGEQIDRLLKTKLGLDGQQKILDCTCGIGTQALGLSLRGHDVLGSDISPKEIERAREEGARLGASTVFRVSDMTKLEPSGNFDVVLSFDNAVAHLQDENALLRAVRAMKGATRVGGYTLISLRDYDCLAKERPTGMVPRRIRDHYGDRIYMQTWEWDKDGKSYETNLFILKNLGGIWKGKPIVTRIRAYRKAEVLNAMNSVGFTGVQWWTPAESGFYQPIVIGRNDG